MSNSPICEKLREMLHTLLSSAYERNLEEILSARGQELWLLGVDAQSQRYVDICETIDPKILTAIRAKGFWSSQAGYRADAQKYVCLGGKHADILFLNVARFTSKREKIEALIVHELAHLLEHIGESAVPEGNDEANATAILASLTAFAHNAHSDEWALHLAGGARRTIEKRLTPYKTIRKFLNVAVPLLDRTRPIQAS
jgi:hypothetical protein